MVLGNLIHLNSVGNEDRYLYGNPQMTYFKSVYQRASNFAINYSKVPFIGNVNVGLGKEIKFNIPFFNKDHLKNKNILMNNSKFSGNNFFSKKCEYILSRKFNFKNVLLTDSSSSSFEIISTMLAGLISSLFL